VDRDPLPDSRVAAANRSPGSAAPDAAVDPADAARDAAQGLGAAVAVPAAWRYFPVVGEAAAFRSDISTLYRRFTL
jgi:hypothetical protein